MGWYRNKTMIGSWESGIDVCVMNAGFKIIVLDEIRNRWAPVINQLKNRILFSLCQGKSDMDSSELFGTSGFHVWV